MNHKFLSILTTVILVLFASRIHAEPTVQDWIKSKNQWMAYLAPLATGISWANVYLDANGQKKIYCMPEKFTLEVENYVKMIDTEIREDPRVKFDSPLGYVLLLGHMSTFPCR